jgi:hypothetical protein
MALCPSPITLGGCFKGILVTLPLSSPGKRCTIVTLEPLFCCQLAWARWDRGAPDSPLKPKLGFFAELFGAELSVTWAKTAPKGTIFEVLWGKFGIFTEWTCRPSESWNSRQTSQGEIEQEAQRIGAQDAGCEVDR